jgi:glycosyltransferase involved in cell wall biosynthesis
MNSSAQQSVQLRILSNLRNLGNIQIDKLSFVHRFLRSNDSLWGGAALFMQSFNSDIVILDGDSTSLIALCFLRMLFPFRRCQLVSLDIVLARPQSIRQQVVAKLKKWLLREVDHFILYFKDTEGYGEFFGISHARSLFYIPFKVNLPRIPPVKEVLNDGENVVAIGRSHRDVRTFIAAMRQVDYPGVLLHQEPAILREHGTDLDMSNLPANLRLQLSVDGDGQFEEVIRRAKLVVVPIAADCISSAGIGSYLLAMAFRRCVIISDCPATRGLLRDEAIIVPPGDARALAEGIRHAWEEEGLRMKVAEAGYQYAEQLGGKERLLHDVVNLCGNLITSRRRKSLPPKSMVCRQNDPGMPLPKKTNKQMEEGT